MKPTFTIDMQMVGFAIPLKGCTHPTEATAKQAIDRLCYIPFVVSLSNHERPFDILPQKDRAKGINLFSD